jgi:hypothetical protein
VEPTISLISGGCADIVIVLTGTGGDPLIYFKVRNFERFQHYRDRKPPWIKLYRDLWADPSFMVQNTSTKLAIIGCFTLASESDNRVPLNIRWMRKRLCLDYNIDIKALMGSGFIEPIGCDASAALASCTMKEDFTKKEIIVETETETEEQRHTPLTPLGGNGRDPLFGFDEFYKLYPRHEAPTPARKAWAKLHADQEMLDGILAWVVRAEHSEQWSDKSKIPLPATFINQRRWEGDPPPVAQCKMPLSKSYECEKCVNEYKTQDCEACVSCVDGSGYASRQQAR